MVTREQALRAATLAGESGDVTVLELGQFPPGSVLLMREMGGVITWFEVAEPVPTGAAAYDTGR